MEGNANLVLHTLCALANTGKAPTQKEQSSNLEIKY
jgi:hypothetical protein